MSVALEQKQGLIAGDGLLPVKMAQYAKKNGFDVDFKRLKQIYLDSRNRHSDDIEKGKVRALNERLKYED